jgi:hypothetical protein
MSQTFNNHGLGFQVKHDLPTGAENSAQFMLIALLAGTISISVKSGFKAQSFNYTTLPHGRQTKRSLNGLKSIFSTYDIGEDLNNFVGVTLADNRGFYQELLIEFSQFFLQTNRGAHTAAFVFLYRIIERLFYSIPLLYVSTTKDYVGTFEDLKGLFVDDKTGERGFFKKFLNQGRFIDNTVLDQVFILNLSATDGVSEKFDAALRKIFKAFVPAGPSLDQVGCKFRDVPDLLAQMRNRFFHSRTGDGQPNMSMKVIGDPDMVFARLNPIFCNVLAVITIHSIAKKYARLEPE